MNDVVVCAQQSPAETSRALEVRDALLQVKTNLEQNFFIMCELLSEAHAEQYNLIYGFSRFDRWVEEASGLDISARQGFYYISIAHKIRDLGLTKEQVTAAKITNLKKIFELEAGEHGAEMKDLVLAAATENTSQIRERVDNIKRKAGIAVKTWSNIRIDNETTESKEKAYALARMNLGPIVNSDGVSQEPSDNDCLKEIFDSYVLDDNNRPEGWEIGALMEFLESTESRTL